MRTRAANGAVGEWTDVRGGGAATASAPGPKGSTDSAFDLRTLTLWDAKNASPASTSTERRKPPHPYTHRFPGD